MRKIIFRRDRKFNSAIIPVFVYMDEKQELIGTVKNGKEIIYHCDDEEHSFYIAWTVSTDPKNTFRYSEKLFIDKSYQDVNIRIKHSYSFRHGAFFSLILID